MSTLTNWAPVLPQLMMVLAILFAPGFVIAICLRFRLADALAFATPLSLGAVALAIEVSTYGKVRWGLPVILVGTVVLCIVSVAYAWIGRASLARESGSPVPVPSVTRGGAAWSPTQRRVALVATLLAAAASGYVAAKGIADPHMINQTYDGAFHVNSIDAIARQRAASSAVFSHLSDPTASGGFYPPTFGAVAAILVIYGGVGPIVAANVSAVAIAILWPIAMSILIRRLSRSSSFGYAIAMVAAVTVGLFPGLLLQFGTLWPNALSYLALGPALVLMLRLCGLDRSTADADDPRGRLPLLPSLAAAVLVVIGMAFAHPGALFVCFYSGVALLLWLGGRRILPKVDGPLNRAGAAAGIFLACCAVALIVVVAARQISAIRSVTQQKWAPYETWYQALGQVIGLGTTLTAANAAMAALLLLGLWAASRSPRGRWLILNFVGFAGMAIMAASVQNTVTHLWTGFWYNDSYRIFAVLSVFALPLIALGADEARALVARLGARVGLAERLGRGRRWVTETSMAGVAVCLLIVGLQGGLGMARVAAGIEKSYQPSVAELQLVTPGQAAMFKRLRHEVPPGKTIAGNPFTGEILAGVLSGRPSIFPTFSASAKGDREMVRLRFFAYASDPQVCAAVQRLHIGVVVTSNRFFEPSTKRRDEFAGFDNLGRIPGLTRIDGGGGAVAYRIGPCRT